MADIPDQSRKSRRHRWVVTIRLAVLLALVAAFLGAGLYSKTDQQAVPAGATAAHAIVLALPPLPNSAGRQDVSFTPESIVVVDTGAVHIDASTTAATTPAKKSAAHPAESDAALPPAQEPTFAPVRSPRAPEVLRDKPTPPRQATNPGLPRTQQAAQQPPRKPAAGPPDAAHAAEGRLPALRAGFDAIGWSAWVSQMTRLQARFYVVADDGSLGSEIDVMARHLIKRRDPSEMDLNRPFLIRNAQVGELLQNVPLPKGYREDVVVMLLAKWSSRFLWERLDRVLKDRRIEAANVSEIEADYVFDAGRFYLAVHEAILREDGKHVPLKEMVEIPS